MQTSLVDLILVCVVGAVFLVALRGGNWGWAAYEPKAPYKRGMLAKFFDLFWGWADYKPQDWSKALYKRGYDGNRSSERYSF